MEQPGQQRHGELVRVALLQQVTITSPPGGGLVATAQPTHTGYTFIPAGCAKIERFLRTHIFTFISMILAS